MQPGDQVICSYEEYVKFKKLDTESKQLSEQNTSLKKQNLQLSQKLSSLQHKFLLKNALFTRQQLKVEYLILLLDDIRTSLDIKPQAIGHGFKQMKGLDESTRFSVLRSPCDLSVDINERLPEGFSKPDTYMEIDVQFQAYKALAEVCTKEWKEKIRTVEYLEKELQQEKNKKDNAEKLKEEVKSEPVESTKQRNQLISALKNELTNLKKENICLKTDLQHQSKLTQTLHQQLAHMEEQLLDSTKALQSIQKPQGDTKTRLMNLITQYAIEVSEGMMSWSLTFDGKRSIVENQLKDIEKHIKQQLGQIIV